MTAPTELTKLSEMSAKELLSKIASELDLTKHNDIAAFISLNLLKFTILVETEFKWFELARSLARIFSSTPHPTDPAGETAPEFHEALHKAISTEADRLMTVLKSAKSEVVS